MATPSALPPSLAGHIDTLMIDNFDSFTYNLYQHLSLISPDSVTVIRNDAIPAAALPFLKINRLIISPGPGHPKTDSGISRDAISYFAGKVPVLGVCMGLECIVDVFGGEIAYAGEIMHGKTSLIRHDGRGCFKDTPQSFPSTRYHSLSASIKTLPATLAISAVSAESGVIMAVRHRTFTVEAVQYHPESILSENGDTLLSNFLKLKGGTWEQNPLSKVLDISLPPFPAETLAGAGPKAVVEPKKLPTILETIYEQRAADVEAAKSTPGTTAADIQTLLSLSLSPPLIPLVSRLKPTANTTPALMAEIKRASPSKGPIAMTTNAAEQALKYALAGASVISVLTEPKWFKGSVLDMRLARQAIDSLPNRPAILRKDFILDEYQIAEARLHGADTVLLIVAMLPPYRLKALYAYSLSLGMEPLVEVNNAAEMTVALELGAKVIGVNNRNLHSFEVDMGTTSRLADMVKDRDAILCALSGISSNADVKTYVDQGVRAVLVGEALMRAKDTGAFIRELLGWPASSDAVPESTEPQTPLVKICCIRTVDEALAAKDAGADLLGLMFVPSSKRVVSVEEARKIASTIRSARFSSPLPSIPSPTDDPHAGKSNKPWFTSHAQRISSHLATAGGPILIGVFQNQPLAYILSIIASVQLDAVQLHGNEPLQWASHIPVPVIRVFHVTERGRGTEGITRPGLHECVLLDAMRADGLSGGSGKVVDWELARQVVEVGEVRSSAGSPTAPSTNGVHVNGSAGPHQNGNGASTQVNGTAPRLPSKSAYKLPLILAGGLTPDNVREAVERVRPWAVDVSGGVEAEGGGKDAEKVRAFIRAAKGLVHEEVQEVPNGSAPAPEAAEVEEEVEEAPIPKKGESDALVSNTETPVESA